MKVTRENYEIWFLDYLEGSLDQDGREKVQSFLLNHPDLADELESFSPVLSTDADLMYPRKELLKKSQYDDSRFIENIAIAEMEGDLTEAEASEFKDWLSKHPDQQEYISRIHKIRLQPDLCIVFPRKENLKKKLTQTSLLFRLTAVAALLLLAFLLFKPSGQKPVSTQLSVNTHITAVTPGKASPENEKSKSGLLKEKDVRSAKTSLISQKTKKTIHKAASEPSVSHIRQLEPIRALEARVVAVQTDISALYDLMPVRMEPVNYASDEIPITEYLNNKLRDLKDQGSKGFFTREEVTVAGLRFFSRLPGKHLTGEKGKDGKLKSISFNSQPLAISIPLNK